MTLALTDIILLVRHPLLFPSRPPCSARSPCEIAIETLAGQRRCPLRPGVFPYNQTQVCLLYNAPPFRAAIYATALVALQSELFFSCMASSPPFISLINILPSYTSFLSFNSPLPMSLSSPSIVSPCLPPHPPYPWNGLPSQLNPTISLTPNSLYQYTSRQNIITQNCHHLSPNSPLVMSLKIAPSYPSNQLTLPSYPQFAQLEALAHYRFEEQCDLYCWTPILDRIDEVMCMYDMYIYCTRTHIYTYKIYADVRRHKQIVYTFI